MRRSALLPILVFVSACASAPKSPIPTSEAPARTEIHAVEGDPRIGTYVSSWKGFRTSSYWIEGPTGLILIDTQFLLSAAEEMIDSAERITGKKVKLAIVLHPNPDKFNGTEIFQRRGIRVVTSQQVLDLIPAVHRLRTGWFYERFKPDYPSAEPKPESFGDHSVDLVAGGIRVKAHVMGPGCSDAHVVVEYDGNAFVGDLVTIGFHSWMELGHVDEWLKRLEEIGEWDVKYIRTGRGGTGEIDALDREVRYLQTVKSVITKYARAHPGKKRLSDADKSALVQAMVDRFPAYDYPKFVENGLDALWEGVKLPSASKPVRTLPR
jgi:glyoxylase-like metal-dependent hydrolase (beta-lactamase superfamily II)